MRFTRREFVQTAAVAVMASTAKGQSNVTNDMAIIDSHQHLWDLTKFRVPWIKPGTLLGRSYVMEDYLAAIEGTGIQHAIYMEVDVDPTQQRQEAEHLVEICNSGKAPTIAAVVSGRPAADDFAAYVKWLKEWPSIKGVRQVLHGGSTPAGTCLGDKFSKGIRQLGEAGLSFGLCLRPKELADGAKLAELCPQTRLIVDHCGNADPMAFAKAGDSRLATAKVSHEADSWRRDIDLLAAQPNVICKISGIVARVPAEWSAEDLAPIVNHCLDSFGPDRVVFGSDWPVCLNGSPLKQWVAALRTIVSSRPASQQRKLYWRNAVEWYGLKV